jgi:1-acyl-sn-glycerol-3-phosphate acyltransferase
VLFAEGTSSDGNRVLPFRSALVGAVETACIDAGLGEVTLQPMSICYTAFQGMPMGRARRPIVAWYGVSFGTPIAAKADDDRKEVARRLENAVRTMTASTLRGRAVATA